MSFILTFIVLSLSFILSSALTPLTLGLWVLLYAFAIAVTTANIISSWFGLIIFLIYIGGLLVMFAYFSAVTPNQQMEISPSSYIFLLTLALLITNTELFRTSNIFTTLQLTPSYHPNMTMLLQQNMLIFLSLGAILFLALVAVVKISRLSAGPLRPYM